jgi:hypothetical protein
MQFFAELSRQIEFEIVRQREIIIVFLAKYELSNKQGRRQKREAGLEPLVCVRLQSSLSPFENLSIHSIHPIRARQSHSR